MHLIETTTLMNVFMASNNSEG